MNIWIDLTNSPHVNFFADMIRELEKDHHLLLTCRPLANTTELLELFGFAHHVVGRHYGQSRFKKAAGFIVRIMQLYSFLKKQNIDAAISHSSFYSPVVARLLGIPSIYLNDNEHAFGNQISFRFADRIMIPEFLDIEKVKKQGALSHKILQYPGIKEGVYLWNYSNSAESHFSADAQGRKTIYVRPEPWAAQYYKGERNFMDDLLLGLKEKYNIVVLPRGKTQEDYYRDEKFKGITVPEKSISLSDIMAHCDLFIGAGGTMTREAAVLGVPTISIYQDALLDVDQYLIEKGFMVHRQKPDCEFVENFLDRIYKKVPDRLLLKKGYEAFEMIKQTLLNSGSEKVRKLKND